MADVPRDAVRYEVLHRRSGAVAKAVQIGVTGGGGVRNGPGSAPHHSLTLMLRRARDTCG